MQNVLNGKMSTDFAKMNQDELEIVKKDIWEKMSSTHDKSRLYDLRQLLIDVNHHLLIRKLYRHKHSSSLNLY